MILLAIPPTIIILSNLGIKFFIIPIFVEIFEPPIIQVIGFLISVVIFFSALISVSKTKDDRGILIGAQAESLHIPSDLAFTADQILNSPLSTTIANSATNVNDINSIRNQGLVPNGFFVNRRFTDTNGYFIKTDVPNGAKMFVRSPLQTKMEPDFDTGNLRFKARERYAFGFSDWRGFFGSQGA